MFLTHDWTSKALLLFGAVILVGHGCDAGDDAATGGIDAISGAETWVDPGLLVDQLEESDVIGSEDASADLAVADAPDKVIPPVGKDVEGVAEPRHFALRTATFALG